MATGDNYFTCERSNEALEQALRKLIYNDGTGKPIVHTNPEGTDLEPWFTCDRQAQTLEMALRLAILEDEDGKPYLNTTS